MASSISGLSSIGCNIVWNSMYFKEIQYPFTPMTKNLDLPLTLSNIGPPRCPYETGFFFYRQKEDAVFFFFMLDRNGWWFHAYSRLQLQISRGDLHLLLGSHLRILISVFFRSRAMSTDSRCKKIVPRSMWLFHLFWVYCGKTMKSKNKNKILTKNYPSRRNPIVSSSYSQYSNEKSRYEPLQYHLHCQRLGQPNAYVIESNIYVYKSARHH